MAAPRRRRRASCRNWRRRLGRSTTCNGTRTTPVTLSSCPRWKSSRSATGERASHGSTASATSGSDPDRKSTRLNSSHSQISYAVFCLKKKKSCIVRHLQQYLLFFFFNDTATTEIYTLSLHDALPISPTTGTEHYVQRDENNPGYPVFVPTVEVVEVGNGGTSIAWIDGIGNVRVGPRSEEHTSELQSQSNLVCRLLLEKKKIMYCQTPATVSPLFFF